MANDIIDIIVTDNSDNVQLNVTPNLVSINVSNTSGNIIGSNYFLVSTFAALPAVGESTILYVVSATSLMYRWNGSAYVQINSIGTINWGSILGTLSSQTDLQTALNLKYNASNPSGYTTNVGTVTSVGALTLGTTGTDVSSTVATGTTTPVITLNIPTASASNRGALSSTDWTTFNNKANALSGTTNYISKFTSGTALGISQIFDNGTNVGIGTTALTRKLTVAGETTFFNGAPTDGAIPQILSETITLGFNIAASSSQDISTINVTLDKWKAIVKGSFANNFEGGGLVSPALEVEVDYLNPTIGVGSTSITFSRNSSTSKLQVTNTNTGVSRVAFVGTIQIIDFPITILPTSSKRILGNFSIGSSSSSSISLNVSKNITGSINSNAIQSVGAIQSGVTTSANYYSSIASTQATAFTLTDLRHFYASQGTIGAGSTVTNQYGFFVDSNIIGATNDYGFFGNIASGANMWNLYMNGSAKNYLAGSLLVGSTTDAGFKFDVTGTTRVSGVLTLSSTISNGTFTYTLPGATGTLALTSALSGYLPLTGGTLTGALGIGTSPVLRLDVQGNAADTGTISGLTVEQVTLFRPSNGVGGIRTGFNTTTGDAYLWSSQSGASLNFGVRNAPNNTAYLSIAFTGGSTFSSTATATAFIPSGATVPTNGMYLSAANTLNFATASTNRLTISSTGNLGLGVTPSAWGSGYTGFQMGSLSGLSMFAYTGGNEIGQNFYYDTSYKYATTGLASALVQSAGVFYFRNTASGSANAALTWTNAMTLDASGRLGIGTTAPAAALETLITSTSTPAIRLRYNSASYYGEFLMDGNGDFVINTPAINGVTSGILSFKLGNSYSMRLFANGNFAINTATDSGFKLNVNGTGNFGGALTGTTASFSSSVTASRFILTTDGTNAVYSFVNATNTYAGSYVIQAGGGSSGYGGAITAYGHSHATKPGWIMAGISAASGGKFTVNTHALGTGIDIFVVQQDGTVGIGVTSPAASSLLDITSTTKGFLPPRMTTTQKNAIGSPATGLVVFDSTLGKLCVFSTTWQTITSV